MLPIHGFPLKTRAQISNVVVFHHYWICTVYSRILETLRALYVTSGRPSCRDRSALLDRYGSFVVLICGTPALNIAVIGCSCPLGPHIIVVEPTTVVRHGVERFGLSHGRVVPGVRPVVRRLWLTYTPHSGRHWMLTGTHIRPRRPSTRFYRACSRP